MTLFGDTEPADAVDVTAHADPEQVARRLHELRRERDRTLAPWDTLGAGERAAAVAIMLALLEWLRREGTRPQVGARYLTDLVAVLAGAGVVVVEVDGWQTRGRSSGGYDTGPWAVFWHHTASAGDGAADAHYCTYTSPDRPVCNVVVDRDGTVFVCAAGATNTNGKGGPHLLPSGLTLPLDGANSRVFGMELSNDGVGMDYPAAQLNAAFTTSIAVAAAYGCRPDDVVTHQVWAPTRKIDPATAGAVQGPWRPPSSTSSGTWDLDALRAECLTLATPPDQEEVPMYLATLTDGTIVVAGSAVRPISLDELNGPFAALPRYSPPPESYWHAWLAAAAGEYTRRVGMQAFVRGEWVVLAVIVVAVVVRGWPRRRRDRWSISLRISRDRSDPNREDPT